MALKCNVPGYSCNDSTKEETREKKKAHLSKLWNNGVSSAKEQV